jgi:hypothetical protein
VRSPGALVVCIALLLSTGAQAAGAALLKGRLLSQRALTVNRNTFMLVRLKVDAVLAGHWRGRVAVAQVRHMAHGIGPGTPIYMILTRDAHGRLRGDAWDFADHGVCLTPKQQTEYGIDPTALPKADRCDPE